MHGGTTTMKGLKSRGISIEPWLTRFKRALARAQIDPTAQEVHQLRVIGGRLRAWLSLGHYRVLHDDLRWLRQSAAAVRTLDVLLEKWPKAHDVTMAQRRARALTQLQRTLRSPRVTGLIAALRVLPALSSRQAQEATRRLARAALVKPLEWSDADALHAVRRKLRRLRYALEWQHHPMRDLAALQRVLGDLNDLSTLTQGQSNSLRKTRKAAVRRGSTLWAAVQPRIEELAQ